MDSSGKTTGQSSAKLELLDLLLKKKGIRPSLVQAIPPRKSFSPCCLSFAQERLWFLDQLVPNSVAYLLPAFIRLTGSLDIKALQETFTEIVRRHESLRTSFSLVDSQPVQNIHAPQVFDLRVTDLSHLGSDEREQMVQRLAIEESNQPFDLRVAPLLRARLLRLTADEHVLLLIMHHIVSDGWSIGVLVKEVAALYGAFQQGEASPLEELPIQYADYAAWQREQLSGAVLDEQMAYWREHLAGAPAVLDLPTDRPRPAVQSYRGARHTLELGSQLTRALKVLSQQHGVTLFMTLLSAFQVLLHRYSGQEDIVVGTPVAGRTRAEIEGLIGFFINIVAIRVSMSGNPTFAALLTRVREACLGAYAHQAVPFERLVEELAPERTLSHPPIIQVTFNMLNLDYSGEQIALNGLKTDFLPPAQEELASRFDLALYARELGDGLQLELVYSDLFTSHAMEQLLDHLHTLLQNISVDPQQRLAAFALSTGLRAQRPEQASPTNPFIVFKSEEIEQTIQERFEKQVSSYPGNTALRIGKEIWTYQNLNHKANQIARAILGASGSGEHRIALLLNHNASMVAGILGILKAGKTYVPLDAIHPAQRLTHILSDSGAEALLTDNTNLPLAQALIKESLQVINLDQIDASTPGHNLELPCTPDSLAYILYTSGSTGEPKGVVQNHRNVLHHIRTYTNNLHICADDKLTLLSSYAFDASVMDIFGALLNGATLCPIDLRSEDLTRLSERLIEEEITIYHSTPTVYRHFVNKLKDKEGCPSVRLVVLGGEVVQKQDFELYQKHFSDDCLLVNGFGPTESTVTLQYFVNQQAVIAHDTVPIGQAVENTRVSLVNEAGEQAAIYGVGEIVIKSPHVALGYWRRPKLTETAFSNTPAEGNWRSYRTGDLGRWQADGTIEYVGRRDDQVKIRGHRIELGEVEAALRTCRGVGECVVVMTRGDRLAAYVVPGESYKAVSVSEWRQQLGERLPQYMVPSVIMVIDKMPLSANGKVDKRALPEPEMSRDELAGEYEGPRTVTEEILVGIWMEVLTLERIGIHDNFFELGGHSLLATQVIARIRQAFPVEIALLSIFEQPTIAGLAYLIDTRLKNEPYSDDAGIERIKRNGFLPLSFAQQRLWFLDQLTPASAVYNISAAVRLSGSLDLPALEQTFTELLRRHESLRTSFTVLDSQAVQLIAEPQPFRLPLTDLTALGAAEREQMVQRLITEEVNLPFDLSLAPLLRARLLQLSEQEQVLVVTMHHIVSDGWSMGVLIREVAALYSAFSQGQASPLAELPVQYGDYAVWQRERLQGAVLEAQLSYWRAQLQGAPAVLELPTDRSRPAVQSYRGGTVKFELGEETTQALNQFSRRAGVTLFMQLLSAWAVLLWRYTGQADVVVGTPIANRNRAETEGLIGFFVNTLALRVRLSGNPSYRELLERVREVCLGAYAHQEVPFEKIVEELQPERELSYTPVFQVMLILQNAPVADVQLPGLRLSQVEGESRTAKFDLTLSLAEAGKEIVGGLEYNADLFDEATVARLAGHFQTLVAAIVAHPERGIADLALLSAAERQQILERWNDTSREYEARCLHEVFERQVERTPEARALVSEDEQLSYGDLNRRANQLAHYLQAEGVGPETLVGICMERSVAMIVSLLAVLKAGGAYVPLDPNYPRERLVYMLEDARVAVLLTQDHLEQRLTDYQGAVLRVDREWERIAAQPVDNPASQVTAENLAYVIYTSGSTGRPKGVLGTHRACINRFEWMWERYPFEPDEICCQKTSLSFVDSIWEIFGPLLRGVPLVLIPEKVVEDPELLLATLAGSGVTRIVLVPSLLSAILDVATKAQLPLLRYWVSSGETLSVALAERFRERLGERHLINLYGSSEVCADATYYETPAQLEKRSISIGRPIANTEVFILDALHQPVPAGVIGEIFVGGAGLARGYLNRPDLTAERFLPHPFSTAPGALLYRTGDLGRYFPDGNIEYLGRVDNQVKLRGIRVELGEIESLLNECPAVSNCVVMVRQVFKAGEPDGDARLVAYVVADQSDGGRPAELRSYLRTRLPEQIIPNHFVMLDALPLMPNGKVDRQALLEFDSTVAAAVGYVAPRNPVEELIAAIWSEVLDVGPMSVADNFFELGGHSLLATQVVSRVRELFKVELALLLMFEEPTVAGLASRVEKAISGGRNVPGAAIRRIKRNGFLPLSFAQQRLWFLDQLTPASAVYNISAAVRLSGSLDLPALEQTFTELLRRHESLRTSFTVLDSQAVQLIAEPQPFRLPLTDLTPLGAAEREQMVQHLITEEANLPFDLSLAPLLRARLLQLSEQEQVLVVTMHHIVSDGWSMGVLIREVAALYSAFSQGQASPLAELPVQYGDYAVWQRERLQGAVLEAQLSYWRAQLQGAPAVLELPSDRSRPAVQSYRGGTVKFGLGEETTQALNQLSRRAGVTLFMQLLSAWSVLLWRYTGQADVVVGTPIANRNRAETEGLIGFFVNTLALRVQLSGKPSYEELLGRVREVCLGAYAHQEVPFEKIVEELQPERELSYTPVFQVMLILQNAPVAEVQLPGLRLSQVEGENRTAKFDLTLSLAEAGKEVVGGLEYNAELFDEATVARLAGHFQMLVADIVAHPERGIADLALLSAAERRQILQQWNDTSREYEARCLHEVFERQVERTPEARALVFEDEELSYGELNRRANQLAHYLQGEGVGPETLVGICMERSVAMIVSLLAVLKAGGAYVPLDPNYPRERLVYMLEDARVAVLLTQGHIEQQLPDYQGLVLRVDTEWELIAGQPVENPASPVTAENLAYVIYTSGSTGRPKGVLGTHRACVNRFEWMWEHYPFEPDEVCCQKTSLSFADSIWEIFGPLAQGVPLVLIPDDVIKDPPLLLETLAQQKVTRIVLVPSLLRAILDSVADVPVPRLRYWSSSGEALGADLAQRFRERLGERCLINLYGCSEVCADVTYYELPKHLGERRVPIGQPIANTQAFILDAYQQPVPQGVSGEIYIGGAELTRGYLNRPDLTAERFVPHPFSAAPGALLYRTGDLGRYLPDGNIEYFGRSDNQVKLRGQRIELGEIETVLNEHPAVSGCVVKLVGVARTDGRDSDARLVAYVIADETRGGRAAELHRYLQGRVPEHMIPAHFLMLDALPLTPSGKVDRRALPAFDPTAAKAVGYVAPRSPVEELIESIWSEVLGVRSAGVHDNFFELGGHSLLATQVITRMRQVFPVEIALRSIFEQPTVAGLSRLVEGKMLTDKPSDLPAIEHIERDGPLPLSFAQQRLWFLNQLEPGNPVYNIPVAIQLIGSLDHATLRQAFSEVLRRHESLRTGFSVIDAEAVQVVSPPMLFDLPLSDLSHLERREGEQTVQAIATKEAAQPFDLGRPPLLRGRLLRLGQEEHVLLLTMHHIVSDGWSMGVLVREIGALYTSFLQGQSSPLPELRVQYGDYSVWQRQQLQSGLLNAELQYWQRQLNGAPPVLELPTDRVRPAVQSYRGGTVKLEIDEETAEALKELSRREGVTLFMLLLAAFDVLLWRHTGQEEIVVGAPIANRTRTEVEGLIGFFVNTLALRVSLKGNPTFHELVRQVREVCLGAYGHQEVPFEKLLQELEPERSLSHTPVFQVMLVVQNAPAVTLELPGLKLSSMEIGVETAKFDLTLFIWETEQGIDGRVEYNRDLFDHSSIERMVEHLNVLLSNVLGNPDRSITSLSLLSAGEQYQLTSEWNQTHREYPSRCLHELFEEQVEQISENTALIFEDEVLSYRELNEKANQLAHYLQAAGVGPEVLVGVMMQRSVEMVIALLAVLKAGGAYVPLDPEYPRERLSFMLEDAGFSILLTQERLVDFVNDTATRVVAVDREWSVISQASRDNPASAVSRDSLAYVIYTSGSTGLPKGAMNSHGAISNRVLWMQDAYALQADDVILQKTPFSFDVSVWEFFWPLVVGARLVLARAGGQRESRYLVELIKRRGVTTLHFVPSMLAAFLEESSAAECHSLRRVICSGEALTIELQARFFNRFEKTELHNLYGPTEAAIDVTYWNCERASARRSVPIGRPITNTAVYILDEQMGLAPVGVTGELYIGGAAVGRGYWRRAGLTAERFVPDPYGSERGARLYRTGDVCRWLNDGNIEYVGRSDDQVKVRGHRVELGEVESALRRCAGVRDCVVMARTDDGSGPRLVAYVVAATEEPVSRSQWREELSAQLPDYMIPAVFMVLAEIPVTVNGKVDRLALPAPEVSRSELSREYAAARTATEELLIAIWSEVLRVEGIGVDDNFFELGGDSILGLQIVAKAAQAGLHLVPKQLFKHQTIAELATAAAENSDPVVTEQGPITGDVPLTPVQKWFFEGQPIEPHHFNQAVLFEIAERANHDLIRKAVEHLFEHHDALRMRFDFDEGSWRQFNAGLEVTVPFAVEDLSQLSDDEQREAVESAADRIQRSLHLMQGPLARVVLFELGKDKPARLLMVVHHLVVDAMSWRILLEDLQTAYGQLSHGDAVRLPRKTSSYKQWAEQLEEYARSDSLSKEALYWLDERRRRVRKLPRDRETGAHVAGRVRTVFISLDEQETRELLQDVPAVYNTSVNDALLTALVQTFARWSGERCLLVDVEGHGREEIVEGINISRTVGWFTTIFPVLLEVSETDDLPAIKQIKEQLHEIPQRGIGYGLLRYLRSDETSAILRELPPAEVLFNYLGQFDSVLAGSTLLGPAQESIGKTKSEKETRRHLLEINAGVSDGRLQITWNYSEHLHHRATIEWLAAEYADALRRLINHRESSRPEGFAPADFPGARLNQEELNTFLAKFKQGQGRAK